MQSYVEMMTGVPFEWECRFVRVSSRAGVMPELELASGGDPDSCQRRIEMVHH